MVFANTLQKYHFRDGVPRWEQRQFSSGKHFLLGIFSNGASRCRLRVLAMKDVTAVFQSATPGKEVQLAGYHQDAYPASAGHVDTAVAIHPKAMHLSFADSHPLTFNIGIV